MEELNVNELYGFDCENCNEIIWPELLDEEKCPKCWANFN